jgi:hypothetical protein
MAVIFINAVIDDRKAQKNTLTSILTLEQSPLFS